MFLLYLLRDKADMEVFPDLFPVYMMMGMMMFFGIYFWFFMKEKLDTNSVLSGRTVMLRNFMEPLKVKSVKKGEYVL